MKLGIQLNVVGPYWFGGYKFDVNAENQNWIEFPARIQGKSIFRDFLKRFKTRIKGIKIEGTAEEIGVFSRIVRETLPEVELTTKEFTPEVQQTQQPEAKVEVKAEEPETKEPEQPKEEAKVEEPAETKEPEQPKEGEKVEEPAGEQQNPPEEAKVEDPDPDPELVDEVKNLMEELDEKFSDSEAAEFLKGQHDLGVSKVDALTALRDKLIEMKKELEAQAQAAEETKEPETPESPEQPQEEAKVEDPETPAEPAADPDPEPEQPKEEAKVEEPKDDPEPQDPDPDPEPETKESEEPKDEE